MADFIGSLFLTSAPDLVVASTDNDMWPDLPDLLIAPQFAYDNLRDYGFCNCFYGSYSADYIAFWVEKASDVHRRCQCCLPS